MNSRIVSLRDMSDARRMRVESPEVKRSFGSDILDDVEIFFEGEGFFLLT
jgi:hypothetical protein